MGHGSVTGKMITENGIQHVFVIEEWSEDDTVPISVHETREGAERYLEEHGYLYLVNGAPGWKANPGWYRHVVEGCFRDEWLRGMIFEMIVLR